MKKIISLAALCLGLAGCGTPNYHFTPYVGQQQNWAVSPGGYVRSVDGVEIFTEYPNRPYEIVGAATVDNEENLAKAVKYHHADAAIIARREVYNNGWVAFPGGAVPLQDSRIVANLIRFKR